MISQSIRVVLHHCDKIGVFTWSSESSNRSAGECHYTVISSGCRLCHIDFDTALALGDWNRHRSLLIITAAAAVDGRCWWGIITYQSLGGVIYGQYLADATDRFNDLPICLLVQRSVYVSVCLCVCVLHVCWPFNLFLLLFLNCLLCLIRLPFSRKHCLFYQQDKKGNLARQVNAHTHTLDTLLFLLKLINLVFVWLVFSVIFFLILF